MAKPRKTTTTGRLLDIALKESRRFARRKFHQKLDRTGYTRQDVKAVTARKGLVQIVAATVLARLAARSVPGALAVGGVVVAKALFDRRKSASATEEAAEAVDDAAA